MKMIRLGTTVELKGHNFLMGTVKNRDLVHNKLWDFFIDHYFYLVEWEDGVLDYIDGKYIQEVE